MFIFGTVAAIRMVYSNCVRSPSAVLKVSAMWRVFSDPVIFGSLVGIIINLFCYPKVSYYWG